MSATMLEPPFRSQNTAYPANASANRATAAASQTGRAGKGRSSLGRELSMPELVLAAAKCSGALSTILWIIAVILVIAGIVTLIRGGILAGIVLIIVGLLLGPGGVSIFC